MSDCGILKKNCGVLLRLIRSKYIGLRMRIFSANPFLHGAATMKSQFSSKGSSYWDLERTISTRRMLPSLIS